MDQQAPTATAVENLLRPYAAFTLPQIETEQTKLKSEADAVKIRQGQLGDELALRFKAQLDAAATATGKATSHVADPATGIKASRTNGKKVDWDNEKMIGIAATMTWEKVRRLFKVTIEMSETIYKGVVATDPELHKLLDTARTVEVTDGKITLKKD